MNNILLEMRKIVTEATGQTLSPEATRVQLKEYLQYFVLDYIYNSTHKDLIFYGGTCLRILSEIQKKSLGRMSEDLDFETVNATNFVPFARDIEKYFHENLQLKQTRVSIPKKTNNVYTVMINLPIMAEIGLSKHKNETLKIRIDIKPISSKYLRQIKGGIAHSLISKWDNIFIMRHFDLPTLMATKIAAILQRDKRGFHKGSPDEQINFKGRDFYDLIWYMKERIIPNIKVLKTEGINNSLEKTFDEIAVKIDKIDLQGIKKDLENLVIKQAYVDSWISNFRGIFHYLKKFYS